MGSPVWIVFPLQTAHSEPWNSEDVTAPTRLSRRRPGGGARQFSSLFFDIQQRGFVRNNGHGNLVSKTAPNKLVEFMQNLSIQDLSLFSFPLTPAISPSNFNTTFVLPYNHDIDQPKLLSLKSPLKIPYPIASPENDCDDYDDDDDDDVDDDDDESIISSTSSESLVSVDSSSAMEGIQSGFLSEILLASEGFKNYAPGAAQHTTNNRRASSGSAAQQASPNNQTNIRRERAKRGRNKNDEDEGEDEDEDENPPKRRAHAPPADTVGLWACHYYKRNPKRFWRCRHVVLREVHRIKGHLKRAHSAPIFCHRCFRVFPSVESRDEHAQAATPCQPGIRPVGEYVTQEQSKKLEGRLSTHLSEHKRWYFLWKVLFPNVPPPADPFVGPVSLVEAEALREFVADKSPTILNELVGEDLPDNLRPYEAEIKSFVVPLFGRYVERLLDDLESSPLMAGDDGSHFNEPNSPELQRSNVATALSRACTATETLVRSSPTKDVSMVDPTAAASLPNESAPREPTESLITRSGSWTGTELATDTSALNNVSMFNRDADYGLPNNNAQPSLEQVSQEEEEDIVMHKPNSNGQPRNATFLSPEENMTDSVNGGNLTDILAGGDAVGIFDNGDMMNDFYNNGIAGALFQPGDGMAADNGDDWMEMLNEYTRHMEGDDKIL